MLQCEDYVYHALFWKTPQDRIEYLHQQFGDKTGHAIEMLETIADTVGYPKLYNTSLAVYAAFGADTLIGVFPTRDEAWKAGGDDTPVVRVVDVPRVEMDNPRYDFYYTEYATEQ